jgi:RHS repeat-associated protein
MGAMLDLQGETGARLREGVLERQAAGMKRGLAPARTGRLHVALGAMALTFLIGLGHPVSIPQAWAQSSPVPFDLIGDQPQVSLLGQLPAHDPTVGTVAGSGGVSGGAATYEIPIIVPPGRRGMQPALSLGYSSRSGNGIAGMGWSLSGLSSLHRCPMTLAQDGQIRAVQLDAQDKLCLDGQRLIATGGTYGATGATYGTELESFVRVTQFGGDLGAASTYFKVERKSGEIAWYGGTSTAATPARVIPGGVNVPLTWMVSVVLDRADNAMHYAYTSHGDGETLVNGIWYTGNSSTLGTRRVSFTYEDRPSGAGSNDRSSSYLAGGVTRQTKRLTAITTFANDVAVRNWVLNYGTGVSASTGRSLLQSVSDCAYDGASWVCKSPTTFAWQHGIATYSLKAPVTGLPALANNERESIRPAGDFDGDGASEILVHRSGGASSNSYIVSLTPERQARWAMPIPSEYGGFWATELQDFNQDGRIDLIGFDANWNVLIRPWSGDVSATTFSLAFGTVWNTGVQLLGTAGLGNAGLQINDMDGDGRADLVITGAPGSGSSTCEQRVRIYRNTPNPSAPQSAPTFPLLIEHCMNGAALSGVARSYESVDRIADFDGDGLMDLWIRSPREGDGSQGAVLHRIAFGRRNPNYSLQSVPFNNLFVSADPRSSAETKTDLFELWTDVNGDGLDDLIYLRSDASGKWSLRLNRGGVMGPRHLFNSAVGAEQCETKSRSATDCADAWVPWRSDKISVGDTDGDGRMEVLVPTRFAANICTFIGPNTGTCPNGEGNSPDCWAKYYCPVSMPQWSEVMLDMNGDGTPETSEVPDRFYNAIHEEVGDPSLYFMTALQFVETAPGVVELRARDTDIVSGGGAFEVDLYGDGHADRLVEGAGQFLDRTSFGIPAVYAGGTPVPESISPRTLPGGLPLFLPRMYVNENIGPGGQKNPDGITPQTQDMLSVVTDGFGQQVKWTYSPLSGEAGRPAGVTPLYAVPTVPAQRYVDEQHIYFTSSMPVVAEMTRSDGIGGFRAWRYAYREAMYHTQGRGFQGFRTIIEEDVLAGLRTTTTFHQKFPLTSQPERVVVNPISRAGEEGPISRETYVWRCDRSNRTNANACVPNHGVPTTYFPFLDTKTTQAFDANAALTSSDPGQLGVVTEIAAADAACSGAYGSTSGYDAYGNLVNRVIYRWDGGIAGIDRHLFRHCVSESNTYTPDPSGWWLDRLQQKQVVTRVQWDSSMHDLPAGTANPTNTITTNYTWNDATRTLATETVQPGVTNQQRVTAYTYNAQGMPTGAAVSASGDPQGTRSTGTAYSADGYFPEVVTNALGHNASTQVRARDGQPTLVTDANGLRTLIDYDAFGVATRKRFRGATDAVYVAPDQHVAVSRCNVSYCWSTIEQYQIAQVQDGAPVSLTRHDAMGRVTLGASLQMDAVWSHVLNGYNAKGQLEYQTEPFRGGDPMSYTYFQYNDILGRMTRKQVPKQAEDGRGDMVTTYSYSGRTTQISVTGSSGGGTVLNLSRTTDSLGRYVETVDAKSGRTRFWYESNGNVAAIEDAKGVVTRAAYNAIGQRMSVNDPNQGNWSFVYNALGEVIRQTDAREIVTSMTYDKLGRPASRLANIDVTGDTAIDAVFDSWTYDPANAKGAPAATSRRINGQNERWTGYTYDTLSRPIQTDITQALVSSTSSYRLRTKYDSYYGRPIGQEFPNGEAVQVLYGNYGHALAEKDPLSGIEYRRLNSVNARSQPVQESFGNGVVLNAQYQHQTGQLTQLHYTKGAANVRKLGYGYDVFGNVKRQSLNDGASREDYAYDELQRMVSAIRSGAASGSISYGYDSVGNLTKKTDFSANTANAYSYTGGSCGGGANAVRSVALAAGGTRTYCYDANGSLVGDNAGLALQYDHQGMTVKATRGAQTDHFRYGPDGARTRSWGSDGARIYLPGYEHRTDTGETKVYVGDYAVISRTGATRRVDYLLKDRLGSVDAVTDSAGTVTETRGYDAFGKPRSGTWNDLTPPKLGSVAITPKGFTQHEHLNQLELIHMNGRVFDYALGRFFSVDPIIQFPLNSQSLNPYSYILNNPLSGTDPTGYCAADADQRRQVCQLGKNTLNALASEVQSMAKGGVSASNVGPVSLRDVVARHNGSSSNGAQACRGPKGPDPNAYKKPQSIGAKPKEEDNGNFWFGMLKAFRDGVAPVAHAIVDPDGTMISTDYDRFGPGPGQVEQGGYKFGNALMVAEGARGLGQAGGGLATKALGVEKKVGGATAMRGAAAPEASASANSNTAYVYRGVERGHPAEVPARDGIVVPGHPYNNAISPLEHNLGGVSGSSPYTSWTFDRSVAEAFAGEGGVILRVPYSPPQPGSSWSWVRSPDKWGEREVLMKGIREGVDVVELP